MSKRFWTGAAIFSICALLYAWIQSGPSFLDPDSFYHAKMGLLTAQQGAVSPFPWLPFTTLADSFADHQWLYHLLLVPFVRLLGPLEGARAAAVVFAAVAITVFYLLLRSFRVRGAVVYALLLGASGAFLLRLNLAKSSSLSLCAVFASLILMHQGRALGLFVLSWLFVWLYGGWPLLVLVGSIVLGSRLALADARRGRGAGEAGTPHARAGEGAARRPAGGALQGRGAIARLVAVRAEVRCALAIVLGIAAGLVVNPYFPQNLQFYWEQIVEIAVVGYSGWIEVGSEWYPYPPIRLIVELSPVFIALFFVLVVLLPMTLSQGRDRRPLFARDEMAALVPSGLLFVVFLAMTLRNRRYVEYFAPFAVLATALLANGLLAGMKLKDLWERARRASGRFAILPGLLAAYLVGLFLFICARDVLAVRAAYGAGIPWTRFARASAWLKANTPEGSIVFHGDFNEFPPLFFYDDRNRYVIGLDPTFLYRKSPERYRLWASIVSGRLPDGPASEGGAAGPSPRPAGDAPGPGLREREPGRARSAQGSRMGAAGIIREEFDSRTVLIGKEHPAMKALVAADPDALLAYEDSEVWIYEIRDQAAGPDRDRSSSPISRILVPCPEVASTVPTAPLDAPRVRVRARSRASSSASPSRTRRTPGAS